MLKTCHWIFAMDLCLLGLDGLDFEFQWGLGWIQISWFGLVW